MDGTFKVLQSLDLLNNKRLYSILGKIIVAALIVRLSAITKQPAKGAQTEA